MLKREKEEKQNQSRWKRIKHCMCACIFHHIRVYMNDFQFMNNKMKKKIERSNVCARTYPWITYNNGSSCIRSCNEYIDRTDHYD